MKTSMKYALAASLVVHAIIGVALFGTNGSDIDRKVAAMEAGPRTVQVALY